MKVQRYISILFLVIITFSSCRKSETLVSDIDYSYFPLRQGNWIIYNVSHRIVDAPMEIDSVNTYQLKEIIDTTFFDPEGRLNYRIERHIRKSDAYAWQLSDVWFACISDNKAQKVEENIRYVKLNFPLFYNKSWNGNIFNSLDAKNYKLTSFGKSDTANGNSFLYALTVLQENRINAIEKYYSVEKYAKDIGMFLKQEINISKTLYPSNVVPAENRMERAELYYQVAVSWHVVNN